MKALVYFGPGDVKVVDREVPQPQKGEVLVKVAASGLCGTDRHIGDGSYSGTKGIVLGHEVAGVVEKLGEGVERLSVGTKVCIDPNLHCHSCVYCCSGKPNLCRNAQAVGVTRDGGMEPYVSVPAELCRPLPEGLSSVHAILGEPLSCVVHAIDRCNPELGTRTAIWGLGTAGLMMIQCLRSMGQETIIGVSHHEEQRQQALKAGATKVMTQEEANEGLQVDLAIEAAGSPSAFEAALGALAPGGRLLLYGVMSPDQTVQLKPEQLFRKELQIIANYTGPNTLDRALALLAAKIVDPELIMGDRLTLEEAQQWVMKEGPRKRAKAHVVFE